MYVWVMTELHAHAIGGSLSGEPVAEVLSGGLLMALEVTGLSCRLGSSKGKLQETLGGVLGER